MKCIQQITFYDKWQWLLTDVKHIEKDAQHCQENMQKKCTAAMIKWTLSK